MRRLILFDIDGTLLMTGGRAGKALTSALQGVFGEVGSFEGFRYSGKTDPQIIRELMAPTGLTREEVDERLDQVFAHYLGLLRETLPPEAVEVLPGVRDTLAGLAARSDVALGLLTGNIRDGAQLKLERAGLDSFFSVGAYGSDNADRNALVPVARRRASSLFSEEFPPSSTVVVGDAEADILCARAGGARAVAVATGWTTRDQLASLQPDALLDSLASPEALPALLDGHP